MQIYVKKWLFILTNESFFKQGISPSTFHQGSTFKNVVPVLKYKSVPIFLTQP